MRAALLDAPEANEVKIALSVPCLELWFLIHFQDRTASISRKDAQSQSKDYLSCDKTLTDSAVGLLIESYAEAKDRAIKLDNKHRGDGTGPYPNPSSGMWRLVESIATGAIE